MSLPSISIQNLSLAFTHKVCFENFSTTIQSRDRIGIIGRNGSGKTSLLAMIKGDLLPSSGYIKGLCGRKIAFIPQIPSRSHSLSGGEIFRKLFSESLSGKPELLLLDEPTNHLDQAGRNSLIKKLNIFHRALIVASHDVDLLSSCVDTIWHINQGAITIFHGNYQDYELYLHRMSVTGEKLRATLQKEQKKLRFCSSKLEERKRKSSKRQPRDNNKMAFDYRRDHAEVKTDNSLLKIRQQQEKNDTEIRRNTPIELPEPRFIIKPGRIKSGNIISISTGWCGFDTPVLKDISISLAEGSKTALAGDNGSGKTTFLKAILNDKRVQKGGDWLLPSAKDIGYLDQHYHTLDPEKNALETIQAAHPSLIHADIRRLLSSFLFCKNEEVQEKTRYLSGGEKARLCLAQIAASPPRLLLLDEVTNNLDRETKKHIALILSRYPGAFILISHENSFLDQIPLDGRYLIQRGSITYLS